MDGTLLDLHFDSYFWMEHLPLRYAQIHNLDLAQVKADLISQIKSEQGKLNWYSLDYWSQRFVVDVPSLKREIQHLISFRADALAFLRNLKKRQQHSLTSLKIVLATNADRKSLDLKLPLTRLDQYVDFIHSSSDSGSPKEEQAYWHSLMQVTPFDPETTLLIDDNESVLNSAHNFGIQQLITIEQPDSQTRRSISSSFPAINKFAELQLEANHDNR